MAFLVTVLARDLGEILATATVTATVTSRSVGTGCGAGVKVFFFFLKSIQATPSASRADMRAGTIL